MSEQPRRRRRQQMTNDEPMISSEESVMLTEEIPKEEIIAPTIPRSFVYEGPKYDIRTRAGLLEYIKTAIELETDLATQERIIEECQKDIQKRKPELKLKRPPREPQKVNEPDPTDLSLIFPAVFLFFGIMVSVVCLSDLQDAETLGLFFFALLLVAVGAGWFIVWNKRIQNIREDNNTRFNAYRKEVELIAEQNKELEEAHCAAVRECDESCRIIAEEAQPHIEETRSVLSFLYSKGVIYPKYCNLPALTSIYEYYMTGRCEELTGPHGAYNIYEDEMRKDTVISQLNTVIENLEQIRQNQYMLYEQVCAIQQNTATIRNELAQIKGYTIQTAQLSALNAYYAARTERNTRILMYYHL